MTTEEKQLKQKLADERRIHTQVKNDLKVNPFLIHFYVTDDLISLRLEFTQSCGNIEIIGGKTRKTSSIENSLNQRSRKIR